jgi:hypothetical protein
MEIWTAITAISTVFGSCATCASTLILFITIFLVRRELHEIRKATYADVFKTIRDILQAEDVRDARRFVFVSLENKPFESWTEDDRHEAEKVCHTYDIVGQLVRHDIFPKEFIVDSWGNSLRRSWRILSPLVVSYRAQWNSMEVWDDFEWLAKEANAFQKPLYSN